MDLCAIVLKTDLGVLKGMFFLGARDGRTFIVASYMMTVVLRPVTFSLNETRRDHHFFSSLFVVE